MAIVTTAATGAEQLEAVFREDGDRLWRALVTFSGDPDLASDAVAEAFAQALRRGDALRDPQAWVWRVSFRLAELGSDAGMVGAARVGMLGIGN